MDQKPSIGRIVHYQPKEFEEKITYPPRPAMMAAVYENGIVDLVIFGSNSLNYSRQTPFSETPKAGHWNWPPRT